MIEYILSCKTYVVNLKADNETHRLARTVGRILAVGFIIVLFNIVSLFTESETVCLFAYSVYFVPAIWMLYFLIHFSMEYNDVEFENYIKRKDMLALLLADSV